MTRIDIASPELAAVEVHGVTRASFILRGAMTAGAVYGAAAVGPYVGNALGAGGGDIDILNFALTLEYLETDFYKVKGKAVGLSGEARSLASMFGDEESQHVDALTKAIKAAGGTPAKKPKFVFPVTDMASFLKLAYVLENTGVGAYNGAGPSLSNPAVPGRGRFDRPSRGAACRRHRPADEPVRDSRRRLRQAADQGPGARQGWAADQGLVPATNVTARPASDPPPRRVAPSHPLRERLVLTGPGDPIATRGAQEWLRTSIERSKPDGT